MKHFQDYTPEKYAGPDYQKVEDGIYWGPNPYSRQRPAQEELFVTSLSFEMEPDCYGEEGGCPQDITQIPFESILDDFSVFVTDFYDELNTGETCYLEFAAPDAEDVRRLRTIIGKHVYNQEDGEYIQLMIE